LTPHEFVPNPPAMGSSLAGKAKLLRVSQSPGYTGDSTAASVMHERSARSMAALLGLGALAAVLLLCAPDVVQSAEEKPERPLAEVIEALRSENVADRRSAAQEIARRDASLKKEALPALIARIAGDKDPQVRATVFEVLTDLGPEAADAVPVLVKAVTTEVGNLHAEEQHGRFRAAWALGAIGEKAVEPLRPALREEKPRVRASAAMAMGRIGPAAAPAAADLISLFDDKDADVRREAVRAMGRIGAEAQELLLAAAQNESPRVRAGAIAALGMTADAGETARVAVARAIADESPEVRASAVTAAGALQMSEETLVPLLIASLAHEDEEPRLAAVNVCARDKLLLARVAEKLPELLRSEHEGVSRTAAWLLQKTGVDGAAVLIEALGDERTRVEQLADAMAGIGSRVLDALTAALRDERPRVRRGAALALGRLRPVAPTAAENLTAALADPEPQVQVAALDSLGRLGPQARPALERVRVLLREGALEPRLTAMQARFEIGPRDEQLLDELTSLVDDAEPRVQVRAIESIRRLGSLGGKSLPAVIKRLDSPDAEVRLAAAGLIGSLGRSAGDAVPALQALLSDKSPELRAVVAETLGQIGVAAQPALEALVRLLEDDEVKVRAAATLALAGLELEPEQIRVHLARRLSDSQTEVREAALAGIRKFRRRSAIFLPDLVRLAGSAGKERWFRETLRRYERFGPDPKSIPELLELISHEELAVRLKAIDFLGLAGSDGAEAIARLELLSDDADEEIRKHSQAAIERIRAGKRGNGEDN
jgi:HEAT repeat protein